MDIIIVGCGKVGFTLVEQLSKEITILLSLMKSRKRFNILPTVWM